MNFEILRIPSFYTEIDFWFFSGEDLHYDLVASLGLGKKKLSGFII